MSSPTRADPRSAELEAFLRGLKPRKEPVTRWALGQLYEPCRTDARWGERIKELLEGVKYDFGILQECCHGPTDGMKDVLRTEAKGLLQGAEALSNSIAAITVLVRCQPAEKVAVLALPAQACDCRLELRRTELGQS